MCVRVCMYVCNYTCAQIDDLEEAYQTLQQMVKDYLSLEEEEEEEEKNNRGASPVRTFTGISVKASAL